MVKTAALATDGGMSDKLGRRNPEVDGHERRIGFW
jgi:hypothetical protein